MKCMRWDTQNWIDKVRIGVKWRDLYQFLKNPQCMFTIIFFEREKIGQNKVDELDKLGHLRWDG